MSLFKSLRRLNTFSKSRDSTAPFEGAQAPFAQAGSATRSAPALPQEYDADAERIRGRCPRFRTLIIGRANAGKTTILQKVCGTTKQPVVYDARGKEIKTQRFLMPSSDRGLHDINNIMVFESNPGFIFHDSRGFEAGGAQELDAVTTFLSTRSSSTELQEQVHAIWYCIPLDDDRPFTRAEINFFSECGTGSVPVIAIFTKFDAVDDKAFGELIEQGLTTDKARARAPDHAALIFERDLKHVLYGMKYPPKSHVLLRDMNHPHASCEELVACTARGIDNAALKMLFVSTQRNNLGLCMKSAMNEHG
ncbi:GTP-binding protein [Athelia psychrophila]|uniref:GTP-binding protein n=1 Tax=Athelia psychrophila TaxID=1759441 RepID=A0A167XGF2_9AGAM|nr:GTP-binding protein [Fibularhizoctonia sp. CBS 109695]KZP07195.1 GTP-binding protein [Fibularhizoctonia sp. CBS 109695]